MSCTKKIAHPFLVSELLPFDKFFFHIILKHAITSNRMKYLDKL